MTYSSTDPRSGIDHVRWAHDQFLTYIEPFMDEHGQSTAPPWIEQAITAVAFAWTVSPLEVLFRITDDELRESVLELTGDLSTIDHIHAAPTRSLMDEWHVEPPPAALSVRDRLLGAGYGDDVFCPHKPCSEHEVQPCQHCGGPAEVWVPYETMSAWTCRACAPQGFAPTAPPVAAIPSDEPAVGLGPHKLPEVVADRNRRPVAADKWHPAS